MTTGLAIRRLSYPEAAAELGVEVTWLQRHIKSLPHTKIGRRVYFTAGGTDTDIERIDAMFHHEPAHQPASAFTTAAPVTELRPLPARGSQKKSKTG